MMKSEDLCQAEEIVYPDSQLQRETDVEAFGRQGGEVMEKGVRCSTYEKEKIRPSSKLWFDLGQEYEECRLL